MTSDNEENDDKNVRQQQARATLRETFLRAISDLTDKNCCVITYEKTTLNATFSGWNPDGSEILVRNLETPSHVNMKSALLRTPDVLAIQFSEPIELS